MYRGLQSTMLWYLPLLLISSLLWVMMKTVQQQVLVPLTVTQTDYQTTRAHPLRPVFPVAINNRGRWSQDRAYENLTALSIRAMPIAIRRHSLDENDSYVNDADEVMRTHDSASRHCLMPYAGDDAGTGDD